MADLNYLRPSSIDQAIKDYLAAEGQAAYLAGGTDLVLKMKKGQAGPTTIVSLTGLPGLDRIEDRDGQIVLGGTVTLSQVLESDLVAAKLPVLSDAVGKMASVQIRNVATVSGNIANAAPSADTAPPLLALGTIVVLTGPGGRRQVPLNEFYVGPFATVMAEGEVITEFLIPDPGPRSGGAYAKLMRRAAMDLALLGVAVQLSLEDDGRTCRRAAIGLGVAAPTPIRCPQAEAVLTGQEVTEDLLRRAGEAAADEAQPRDSIRCEGWYRREMIRVFVRRMGLLALERAQG